MDYPSTLPLPTTSNYDLTSGKNTVRTDMEGGASRVRRRFRSNNDQLNIRFIFTDAEMTAFTAFWQDGWDHGAAWINLTIKDGRTQGLTVREVRAAGDGNYKATPISNQYWQLNLSIETRN